MEPTFENDTNVEDREVPIIEVSRRGHVRLHIFAAIVLVVAIAGFGFIFGHYVVTTHSSQSTHPSASNSNFPFEGFGNFFTNPSSPSSGSSSGGASSKADAAAAATAKLVDPGLVDINTSLSYQDSAAAGTGMVLTSNGLVLTNNHVIEGATSITARDVGNGKVYTATVVGYDVNRDVALLKLKDASGLKTVSTSATTVLTKGEAVVGIGNAGGSGGTPSVAAGTVTALDQSLTASDEQSATGSENLSGMIETNANIQPGDSGGPLVTTSGKVVGMDTAASEAGGGFGFENFTSNHTQAYSIPINTALRIAKSIEAGDSSTAIHIGATAFMGVEIEPTSSAGQFNGGAPSATGVEIVGLISGTPAASTSLVSGDVITSINGQSVTTSLDVENILQALKPGDSVQIDYVTTSGTSATLSLQLASGPAQ